MKFAICNETFGPSMSGDWSWRQVCETVAKYGYDGVEIAPFTFAENVRDITAETRREIQVVAQDLNLQIPALHWLLVSPPDLHLNALDENTRRKTSDYLRYLADFAADVGAPRMIFGSPKQRRVENGDYQGAWQRAQESFRRVLPTLQERKVILCQEPLPAPECDFITTAAEAKQMVDEMNHPNFQLMLDVKSMCGQSGDETGVEAARITREFGASIEHFHANDANRRGPGFGNTDFRGIAAALGECKYDQFVSVEVFDYTPDPQTIACRSLEYLQRVFEA